MYPSALSLSPVKKTKAVTMQKKLSPVQIAILWLLCLLTALSGTEPAFAETAPAAEAALYSAIDSYLQSGAKNAHIPSMAVTIVNKDQVLFAQAYGSCKDTDTPFWLGSVSKSFTAVCIMQLAERGKLDLNAPISAYLPDAVDGDQITVRQLLNHTSGLGEHQTLRNYRIINEQGIHCYANVNYSLLGKIIEAVSNQSYSDYITQNLLEPLQLTHTAATLQQSLENGLIGGYTNYWGIPIQRRHKYPSSEKDWITVPAGYLSSSANDLGKYLQMYLNGGKGILSAQSIDTLFYGDTVYVEDQVPYWYGYGWTTVKEPLSEPVLRHSGLVETGTSCVYILPDRGIAVAITANVNDYFVANNMMDSLGWGVILMLLGESPNEVSNSTYVWGHIQVDLILLILLAAAILSVLLIPLRQKKLLTILLFLFFHVLLPIFILLSVPIFFATPLWVARAFVPDVFITVVLSAALLLTGGAIKALLLYRQIKRSK